MKITFKNILKIFDVFSSKMPQNFRVNKCLEILGLEIEDTMENKTYILDEITKYLFDTSVRNKGEQVLDLSKDFKYYFHDFLKLGINLNKEDISWYEFDILLEDILLTENTALGKVLQYRTYKPPVKSQKTHEAEERKFYNEQKRKYALKQDVTNGFEKMYEYASKKAGETKNE